MPRSRCAFSAGGLGLCMSSAKSWEIMGNVVDELAVVATFVPSKFVFRIALVEHFPSGSSDQRYAEHKSTPAVTEPLQLRIPDADDWL